MTLTFDPITLKASSAMVGHVMNIYAEFHWYYSTKYRDTASRKLSVDGRTDEQPESIKLLVV